MNDFITVMTFTYPVELAVLRVKLESEEIEYRVLNELTAEVYPFLSNAIGGVKLQVRQSDFQKVVEILKEGGYLSEENVQPSKVLTEINRVTSRLPFIKNLQPEVRLMIAFAFVILIIIGIAFIVLMPSTSELLTKRSWCMDKLTYDGKDYPVRTLELRLIMGDCEETVDIRENGMIWLPGFNSRRALGKWVLTDNSLHITRADTFDFVYNGVYEIDFTGGELILKSEHTTLYCYPQNSYSGF